MEKIELVIGGVELVFTPNTTAYNKFINEMSMDNKVATAGKYLHGIGASERKAALADIVKRPGAPFQLFGKI